MHFIQREIKNFPHFFLFSRCILAYFYYIFIGVMLLQVFLFFFFFFSFFFFFFFFCFLHVFMYELGWNQGSKATMAWFTLQSWGACGIWCSYKLWAALEKSNNMEGGWTMFQKGFPLAWWCFNKNRTHCMDSKSCPMCIKG